MRITRITLLLLLLTVFIGGCIKKEEKNISIHIPNMDDYSILYIQGVDKDGVSTESTKKYITEDKVIKTFISKVNNIEVIIPSNKEMLKKN